MLNTMPADRCASTTPPTRFLLQPPKPAANDARPARDDVDLQAGGRVAASLRAAFPVEDAPFDLVLTRLCLRLKRGGAAAGTATPIDRAMPVMTLPWRGMTPMTGWP